jgi:hypothetical protein
MERPPGGLRRLTSQGVRMELHWEQVREECSGRDPETLDYEVIVVHEGLRFATSKVHLSPSEKAIFVHTITPRKE